MNEKIREYVDKLLQDAPQNSRINELREELISGCMDKYGDLTDSGMEPEEAYRAVVAGIGDVDELVQELSQSSTLVDELKATVTEKGKNAKLRAAASSSLWSLIVIAYFLVSFATFRWDVTWMIFVFGAFLQCLIGMAFAPKGSAMRGLSGMLWTGTVLLYLMVSFFTHQWQITWLIFLIAVAIQQVIRLARLWRD